MRRPRLSTALTLLTIVATLVVSGVCVAQAPRTTEAELRAYTACWSQVLGVTPRWDVTVIVVRDSVELTQTYGMTKTAATPLLAEIWYNLHSVERDRKAPREIALHEVLHVATGEIVGLAFAQDLKTATVESERLVRQMVRWPNWRGVCEQP